MIAILGRRFQRYTSCALLALLVAAPLSLASVDDGDDTVGLDTTLLPNEAEFDDESDASEPTLARNQSALFFEVLRKKARPGKKQHHQRNLLQVTVDEPHCNRAITAQRDGKYGQGAYLCEKVLNPQNVNKRQFGRLSTIKLDSQPYAQPLYVPRDLYDGRHDVLFIATNHNSLYCVDITNRRSPRTLWQVNLGNPVPTEEVYGNYHDIHGEIGLLATPVIDLETKRLYAVAHTYEKGEVVHSLHVVNILDGRSPLPRAVIGGSVPGSGALSKDGRLPYEAFHQLQRTALTMSGDYIVFAMASIAGRAPYHGWVFAYRKDNLKRVGQYCSTRNSNGGGIWQSGAAVTVDENGDFLAASGMGYDGADPRNGELVISVVKLRLTDAGFEVIDWAAPSNWKSYSDRNLDMSTSCVVMPDIDRCAVASKHGHLYLINLNNMGKLASNDSHLDSHKVGNWNIHSIPVPWDSNFGKMLFIGPEQEAIEAYRINNGDLEGQIFAQTEVKAEPSSRPGSVLTLTADGRQNGLMFSTMVAPNGGNANPNTVSGVMRVFDLSNLNTGKMEELYNTLEDPANDDIGNFAKFNPVAVADGDVFVPSFGKQTAFDGAVHIFGLKDRQKWPSPDGRGDASSSTGAFVSSTGEPMPDWSSTLPAPASSTGAPDYSSTGVSAAASISAGTPALMLPLLLTGYLAKSWGKVWRHFTQ